MSTTVKSITLSPSGPLRGGITVPGDKSISHRAVMFGSIAEGVTRIRHFLKGADCLSTIRCFRQMGVQIAESDDEILVIGAGLHGLKAPDAILDTGNSGTTMRLMSGILAGQPFETCVTGDASIRKRPMRRIMDPLRAMGADIQSKPGNDCAPLLIRPASLQGTDWQSPVASAQVKSCILLAGLYADGPTRVIEPALSRDHTERMLRSFGADLISGQSDLSGSSGQEKPSCCLTPGQILHGMDIEVPGDISSAAYFIAAALLVPGSELLIRGVGVNPTRDGILKVCRAMGGDITCLNERLCSGEPAADLLVRHSPLHGVRIEGDVIPTLIDELPMLAVLAAFAEGTTVIADAAELKVKESDRIRTVTENLTEMGADAEPTPDGMIVCGGQPLHGAVINPYGDHRIAMSFAVASLACEGETTLLDPDCVSISYPGFYNALRGTKF